MNTKTQYSSFAPYYRAVAKIRKHFIAQQKLLTDLLNINSHVKRILDASCATGDVINYLQKRFPDKDFCGSDNCKELLDQRMFNTNKIQLTDWNALSKNYAENSKDMMYILGNSIAHCSSLQSLENIFHEVNKVLTPNGLFIFDIRPWGKNIEEGSFNEPNKNSNLEVPIGRGNYFVYNTRYRYLKNRHFLTHSIKEGKRKVNIHLSFLNISNETIVKLLSSTNYDDIKIIENLSYYPFTVFTSRKCKS